MIDEAYQLNGKHEGDPGKLVVPLLMNVSADEKQRDIAIVLCGYKEPMEKLLETNPGLYSRFPNRFEFADFTIDELLEITRRRVKEYEYDFGDALCSMSNSCGWINIEDREWLKAVGERKVEKIVPFEKKIFISVY